MLKHIKTRKQNKQKDLKAENDRKEKEKFRIDTSKKSFFSLIFYRSLQSNLFTNE